MWITFEIARCLTYRLRAQCRLHLSRECIYGGIIINCMKSPFISDTEREPPSTSRAFQGICISHSRLACKLGKNSFFPTRRLPSVANAAWIELHKSILSRLLDLHNNASADGSLRTIDCSHFEWLKIYVKLLDARPVSDADFSFLLPCRGDKRLKNPIERSSTIETIFHRVHHLRKLKAFSVKLLLLLLLLVMDDSSPRFCELFLMDISRYSPGQHLASDGRYKSLYYGDAVVACEKPISRFCILFFSMAFKKRLFKSSTVTATKLILHPHTTHNSHDMPSFSHNSYSEFSREIVNRVRSSNIFQSS